MARARPCSRVSTFTREANLWNAQKGNFGPQFGFNWSPEYFKNKMVVRGGYGLNYNQNEIAITAQVGNNPPGANYYNYGSTSPTAINPNIVYNISSDRITSSVIPRIRIPSPPSMRQACLRLGVQV